MAKAIQQDRRDEVIKSLHEVCKGVDLLDKGLHDPFRGVVDPLLASKDILAWKALGAGGGGCAMLLCNLGKREVVEAACEAAGWSLLEWGPDEEGLTITAS
jgi:mevalonate kinase